MRPLAPIVAGTYPAAALNLESLMPPLFWFITGVGVFALFSAAVEVTVAYVRGK